MEGRDITYSKRSLLWEKNAIRRDKRDRERTLEKRELIDINAFLERETE